MKKILFLFATLWIVFPLWADHSRSVTFEKLPRPAREFVTSYFPGVEIAYIRQESNLWVKEYQVVFVNGCKVEFNRTGNWKEIDCKYTSVPSEAIPEKIYKYIKEKHPRQFVTEIERTDRKYEVKLSNGLEIEFDNDLNLIRYD